MALGLNTDIGDVAKGKVAIGNRSVPKKAVLIITMTFFAIAAVMVFLYYKNPKFKELVNKFINLKNIVSAVDIADQVQFMLLPPEVRPNSSFTIVGAFYDKNGKPQTVKNAYYFVFLDQFLLVQGSIGQNVSSFNTVVPTTGLVNGKKYTVRVSDQPLTQPPLSNANIQPPRYLPIPGTSIT